MTKFQDYFDKSNYEKVLWIFTVIDLFNGTLDNLMVSLQELQDTIDDTHNNYSLAKQISDTTTCLGCPQLSQQIGSMVNDIDSLSQQAVSYPSILLPNLPPLYILGLPSTQPQKYWG